MKKQLKKMLWKIHSMLPARVGASALRMFYAARLSYHEARFGGPQEAFRSVYKDKTWGWKRVFRGPAQLSNTRNPLDRRFLACSVSMQSAVFSMHLVATSIGFAMLPESLAFHTSVETLFPSL
jgi:hypothetical protein